MTDSHPHTYLRGSAKLLYDELIRQNAHPIALDSSSSLMEYTDRSEKIHLLYSTCSDKSSALGKVVAESKARTGIMAAHLGISTPASEICHTIRDARKFLSEQREIVLKPLNGSGGRGVTTNIRTEAELRQAYTYAKNYSHSVVAQQHIAGADVRLLTIGGEFCSAVIRKPAHVIGDGVSTTQQLIITANSTSPRSDPEFLSIMPINMLAARRYLGATLLDVPDKDAKIRTTGPANVSLGGSLHEATNIVTTNMIQDAEKISQRLDLGICGVDIMWDRKTNKHYLIEVNATPGIDIHDDPFSGTSSNAVQKYVTWLIEK